VKEHGASSLNRLSLLYLCLEARWRRRFPKQLKARLYFCYGKIFAQIKTT